MFSENHHHAHRLLCLVSLLSTIRSDPVKSLRNSSTLANASGKWTSPSCAASPAVDLNPFFIPDVPHRQDIIEKKNGIPFKLVAKVIDSTTCHPLPNLTVHVWHVDAFGFYSGFVAAQLKDCSEQASCQPLSNQRFLRGYQITNQKGLVKFMTIAPGWLDKKTMHINIKIVKDTSEVVYNGKLYFTREVSQLIASNKPYSTSKNILLKNEKDHDYQQFNGMRNLLKLEGGLRELRGGVLLAI